MRNWRIWSLSYRDVSPHHGMICFRLSAVKYYRYVEEKYAEDIWKYAVPGLRTVQGNLDAAGVEYQFCDFNEDLKSLKEFLKLRDGDPMYDPVREAGSIGIPTIVLPDGSATLTWEQFV